MFSPLSMIMGGGWGVGDGGRVGAGIIEEHI